MPRAPLKRLAINCTKRGAWVPGCVPLVLVHGLAASSAFWLRVSDEISAFHPVLLYDLRGHGRSGMPLGHYSASDMADDLIELLDALGIDAATLAGHSFGGGVALHAALRWAGRLDGLVVADTRLNYFQPRMTPASWPDWEQRKLRLREIGIEIADDEPEGGFRLLTEIARLQMRGGSLGEHVPRWAAELCGQPQSLFTARLWLELIETTQALTQFSEGPHITPAALSEISPRILAIYGENSPAMPSANALRDARPDIDLRIVPNAGHFFPLTKPEAFTAPVLEFMRVSKTASLVPLAEHN